MKDKVLKFILVISLILNISVLASAGYTHYKQSRHRPLPPAYEFQKVSSHLFEELALKPEQLAAIQEKALPFHAAIANKRQEVDRLRTSLFGLMRADNPDSKAIEATIAQINKAQEEMQRMVVAHMLQLKAMLNKDQQKRFLDLVGGAMTQQRDMQCP
jgi:Spy/CpxP family protein refolding chaperone